jgi:uncharacterized protein (TIGR03643 family)
MPVKFLQRLASLTAGDVSAVIQMAWEDRTSFETIQECVGLSESEVIRLMRLELSPSSFKMWRTRMKGRVTKHRALRSPDMKFEDRSVADHRRALRSPGWAWMGLPMATERNVQEAALKLTHKVL